MAEVAATNITSTTMDEALALEKGVNETHDESISSMLKVNEVSELDTPVTPQTVLRLKRRIEDSPSQVLVMSYKRRKEEDGVYSSLGAENETEVPQKDVRRVFRLAGTVTADKLDSSLAATIKKALTDVNQTVNSSQEGKKEQLKRRIIRLNEKTNKETRQKSTENRFRVVCNKRGIEADENAVPLAEKTIKEEEFLGSETKRLFNLLDLIADDCDPDVKKKSRKCTDPREPGSITCNGAPMVKEYTSVPSSSTSANGNNSKHVDETTGFVFDLYVSNEGVIGDPIHDQLVSVRRADEDYEFDCYQEGESDDELRADDEEDSNDEGNWRNDYPDTDPESDNDTGGFRGYYDDGDLVGDFENVRLNGDDLSSEDEGAVYSIDDDGADDGVGGVYSHSYYQRFKARMRKEQEMADEVVSSPSESECDMD